MRIALSVFFCRVLYINTTEIKSETEKHGVVEKESQEKGNSQVKLTPAARAVMQAEGLSLNDVLSGLYRLNRQDIEYIATLLKKPSPVEGGEAQTKEESHLHKIEESIPSTNDIKINPRQENRLPMTPLRRKLSQRLVAVKNETAMLTTFNEIDMSRLIQLRIKHQQAFTEKYGFKLGYMSFFTKGVSIALSMFPVINSMIDGDDIITPQYHDIGFAVQTPKGLDGPGYPKC